jgi:NO-binding membrane sensor protein with MHYT domain
MPTVDHFAHGVINPALAFVLAFLGSGLALSCAARARVAGSVHRKRWLGLAAMSLGGGIWLMHFTAMLGFDVSATPLRYGTGLTGISAVLAVLVVYIGLLAAGGGRPTTTRIVIGGVFTGAGVSAMHYTGMAAIRIAGSLVYDANLVLASVLVAIVAAMVALWLSTVVRGRGQVLIAGSVMAAAVCAMHYTAMAAVRVRLDYEDYGSVEGVTPISLELPITLLSAVVLVVLTFVALQTVSSEDRILPPGLSGRPNLSGRPGLLGRHSQFGQLGQSTLSGQQSQSGQFGQSALSGQHGQSGQFGQSTLSGQHGQPAQLGQAARGPVRVPVQAATRGAASWRAGRGLHHR